jgi:hypothetical protein
LFLRVRTPPCARPGGGDETGQPRPAFWADDFITGQTINVDGGAKRYHLKVSQIMEANDLKTSQLRVGQQLMIVLDGAVKK